MLYILYSDIQHYITLFWPSKYKGINFNDKEKLHPTRKDCLNKVFKLRNEWMSNFMKKIWKCCEYFCTFYCKNIIQPSSIFISFTKNFKENRTIMLLINYNFKLFWTFKNTKYLDKVNCEEDCLFDFKKLIWQVLQKKQGMFPLIKCLWVLKCYWIGHVLIWHTFCDSLVFSFCFLMD